MLAPPPPFKYLTMQYSQGIYFVILQYSQGISFGFFSLNFLSFALLKSLLTYNVIVHSDIHIKHKTY